MTGNGASVSPNLRSFPAVIVLAMNSLWLSWAAFIVRRSKIFKSYLCSFFKSYKFLCFSSLSRYEIDQLICFPLPAAFTKGFSWKLAINPLRSQASLMICILRMLWSIAAATFSTYEHTSKWFRPASLCLTLMGTPSYKSFFSAYFNVFSICSCIFWYEV